MNPGPAPHRPGRPARPLAHRRMAVVSGAMLLFGLVAAGSDVALPLWATHDLGLNAAQWAHLRSVRFAGVLAGVVLLGAVSDRFGERRVGAWSLLGAAAVMAWLGLDRTPNLWLAMAAFGALVSTVFVNLNVLTQMVSAARQGLANSIYRFIGAGTQVAAPLGATALAAAWGGYATVFILFAALLVGAAMVLWAYPGPRATEGWRGLHTEAAALWRSYRIALRQRPLMRFVHLVQIWFTLASSVGAFAAIRFTRELGMAGRGFGLLASAAGLAAMAGFATAGFVADRLPLRACMGALAVTSGLAAAVMGLGDSTATAAAGFLIAAPLISAAATPMSMWISRAAGPASQAAAFSMHKVVTALYLSAGMALFGWLELRLGIRRLWLGTGALAALCGLLFFRLPEPPLPDRPPAGAPDRT